MFPSSKNISQDNSCDKLLGAGRYNEVVQICSNIITKPVYTQDDYFNKLLAYKRRGQAYFYLKQPKLALPDFDEYIRILKNSSNKQVEMAEILANAMRERSVIKCALKQYQEALDDVNEALHLRPTKDAKDYYERANAKYGLNDYLGAIEDYKVSLRIDPNHSLASQRLRKTQAIIDNLSFPLIQFDKQTKTPIKSIPSLIDFDRKEEHYEKSESDDSDVIESSDELDEETKPSQNVEEFNRRLLEAAKECNLTLMQSLVAQGADPEAQDENGETPLYKAMASFTMFLGEEGKRLSAELMQKRLAITRWLIEDKRVYAEVETNSGQTPLHVATQFGSFDVVKYLVKQANVSVNVKDQRGLTPLHHATIGIGDNRAAIAKWLVKAANAKINSQDNKGATPLYYAAKFDSTDIVEVLLDAGADPTLKTHKGKTAYDIARKKSHTAIMALLSSSAPTMTKIEKKFTNMEVTEKPKPSKSEVVLSSFSLEIPYEQLSFGPELGRGGFGVVYKGTYHYNEVAIKQLHQAQLSSTAIEEFKQEMAIMAQLHSPNIVQLYGICQEPGHYCIVMEYMPKGSLFTVLRSQEPLAWSYRENIALDIAKGLAYLHHSHILHRDLKSLNVLLDHQYRAKLIDFGLAKVKHEISSTSSLSSNKAVGTLAWMAPELFEDKPQYTIKSDIYSYGMVLWELAARQVPFKDIANPGLIAARVCMGKREEIPAETPPKLAKLITFCWAQDVQKRPSAAEAVLRLQGHNPFENSSSTSEPAYRSNLSSNNNNNSHNNHNNSGPSYLSNNYTFRSKP